MKIGLLVIGIVLLALGLLCAVHPDFSYTTREEVVKFGPMKATMDKEENVHVPVGVAALMLIAGLGLVVFGSQMKR
ncbi:MAG: hypothetical protein LAN71_08195 [Acidobacteriia bacterium]|nr:hypothetical protein [Terriglobia bacterium]